MRWKIDDNEELPLAIIEDTEDGAGIAEIGERTERNLAIAAEIVESHNPLATPASTARTDAPKKCECGHKWHGDDPCQWIGKEEDMELRCECSESYIVLYSVDFAAPGSVPQAPKMATCPECNAQNQLTISAFNGRIGLVCGACSQWWSIGEIEHTPYFFGHAAASNGPNKLRRCEVAGCKCPVWYGVKCDEPARPVGVPQAEPPKEEKP